MSLPDEKEIRVRAKAEPTSEIEKKKRRHQHQDIDLLIAPDDGVKPRAHDSRTIHLARPDHAQIVDEKQPDEHHVDGAEFEPGALQCSDSTATDSGRDLLSPRSSAAAKLLLGRAPNLRS